MEAGLSLGSNLGDRLANLCAARDRIAACNDLALIAQSPVYETEPADVPDAYRNMNFLNAVLIVKTTLSAGLLLLLLQEMERAIGRRPQKTRNAPRIIDIDIIYAGRQSVQDVDLVIPHPRWQYRRFVVQPLCDVRSDLWLPGQIASLPDILANLPPTPQVKLWKLKW
ncbi:MAG: 2-amino-4-hydroxy-6-hydroxymethyldihydropteridine diphosphokinase [Kiritimatiellia bacterium]|jgi:2-amino-4-hydroxy-6-hydroxymethyldihydropteridine diphosphokinase